MKQFFVFGVTAAILFALSATVSHFVVRPKLPSSTGSTEDRAGTNTGDGDKTVKHQPAHSETPGARDRDSQGAVARPPQNPGAEETAKLAASLRERLSAVREMEAQTAARQKNLELVAVDIRSERVAIEQLHRQVLEDLKRLDEKLEQIEPRDTAPGEDRQQRSDRLKQMKKAPNVQTQVGLGNLSDLGVIFRNLPLEAATKILEQLAANNETDKAAELLAELPEREAAKILSVLADQNLASQLVEKSKEHKRAHKSGNE